MKNHLLVLLMLLNVQIMFAQNDLSLINLGAYKTGQDSIIAVYLDGKEVVNKVEYRKNPSTEIDDFSFFVGSCAWLIPRNYKVFKVMEERVGEVDFMLWLGDAVYSPNYARRKPVKLKRWKKNGVLHEKLSRQYKQYLSQKKRLNFATKIPNYACLDDHDIGHDNTTFASYDYNQVGLKVFKTYYPNDHFVKENAGYYEYRWKDCAFFVLDNRNFSVPPKTWLGTEQLDWLKNALAASKSEENINFRFIVIGNQVIAQKGASFNTSEEKSELVDFIFDNGITGVLFLTGDVHYTELCKEDYGTEEGKYTLYDFTSSALASNPHPGAGKDHPHRMNVINSEGEAISSLYKPRNYGKVSISTQKGHRICTFTVINNKGKEIWSHSIAASALR